MKNVIITGPTGMVGGLALKYCLDSKDVGKVTIVTRRPTGIKHPKLTEVIHSDFIDYSPISGHLKNQDVALYCIGVYTGAVPADEFTKITVEYTISFAKAILEHNKDLTFCFLSGAGADRQEKSRFIFARAKGKAENFLLKQKFKSVHIFRPGYIYPVTKRKEPNFTYRFVRVIYPLFLKGKKTSVKSTELAAVMVDVGLKGGKQNTYENWDIREHYKKLSKV
jgi:uncharacterized protein YbjT (DUF2867 family)